MLGKARYASTEIFQELQIHRLIVLNIKKLVVAGKDIATTVQAVLPRLVNSTTPRQAVQKKVWHYPDWTTRQLALEIPGVTLYDE